MKEWDVRELVGCFIPGVLTGVCLVAFFWSISDVNHPYPRTPADWKASYEAAVKAEQARHTEAMGMGKGELK